MSHHKSAICHGPLLVECRWEKCGLTQEQFAQQSGLAIRTIRKAETGQAVRLTSLEAMVAVFQDHGLNVTSADFCTDPLSIAQAFVKVWQKHESNMVKQVRHLLSKDLQVFIAGDPTTVPFAGTWHGPSGLKQFWQHYRTTKHCAHTCSLKINLFANGNQVVAFLEDAEDQINTSPATQPTWLCLKFQIHNGLISRIGHYFDTA